jgi:hypothetical protein
MSTFTDPTLAAARDVRPEHLRLALVRLLAWPNLSELPEARQVRVARICSLLARKPTAGHMVARVLDEPEQEVLDTVHELVRVGAVGVIAASLPGVGLASGAVVMNLQPITLEPSPLAKRSLVGKLWSRLTGQG